MIYSRWRPHEGGWDLFEVASEQRGLGDDLPVPVLHATSPIGFPSVDAGRVPAGLARHVGRSPLPRGMIMPISRAGLSGSARSSTLPGWLLGVVGVVVGVMLGRRWSS